MRILCSYCSAAKRRDEAMLPAIERYESARLLALWHRGRSAGTPLYILSGEYGLLMPDVQLPWYDHLLALDEVAPMVMRVTAQLRAAGVTAVEYHTAAATVAPPVAPYLAVVRAACERAGAELSIVELAGDPA